MKQFLFIWVLITAAAGLFAEDLLSRSIGVNDPRTAEAFLSSINMGNPDYDLYRGIVLHNTARGEADKIGEAYALLESHYEATGNPVALGYWGSVQTLRAGCASASGDFIGATADLSRGLERIDEAVAADPGNEALRFLRIFNGFEITETSPTSRLETVAEDIAWLEEESPDTDGGLLLFARGRLALCDGDWNTAFDLLDETVRRFPGTDAARQADDLLWSLEE